VQKLIIVCGLPGSGKTTLAKALSKKLNTTCLHKDSIKESLYEILELSTLEDSKKLGLQSIKLLYKLAKEQLANNTDLIIEAPFYFEEDYKMFSDWAMKYKLNIYSVVCRIHKEERQKRFRERKRHKGHHDSERNMDKPISDKVYNKLPGEIIKVQTNKPPAKLVDELIVLFK
jgi:predicted kinase